MLDDLLFSRLPSSKHFQDNIRPFNSMFNFCIYGRQVNKHSNRGASPPVFMLCGQKLQDIDIIKREVVSIFIAMFDTNNILVKSFRMARDKLHNSQYTDIKLKLIRRRVGDGRTFLQVVFWSRNIDCRGFRWIFKPKGYVGRIYKWTVATDQWNAFLVFTSPISFIFFHMVKWTYQSQVQLKIQKNLWIKKKNVTLRKKNSYHLRERHDESSHNLFSKRLFQQFVVDAYTMIESWRLSYIRMNKKHSYYVICTMD